MSGFCRSMFEKILTKNWASLAFMVFLFLVLFLPCDLLFAESTSQEPQKFIIPNLWDIGMVDNEGKTIIFDILKDKETMNLKSEEIEILCKIARIDQTMGQIGRAHV